MKIAGIDYSMTCPAITIAELELDEEISFDKCSFHYYTDKKKFDLELQNIHGKLQENWNTQIQRFDNISLWVLDVVSGCDFIGIEDYSMGSKGKVFHIAENTGIMKYKLWKNNIPFETFPPSIIKKHATGKGNADKYKMEEAFFDQTGKQLKPILGQTEKQWSPSGDIIDSYFIAQCAWKHYRELD